MTPDSSRATTEDDAETGIVNSPGPLDRWSELKITIRIGAMLLQTLWEVALVPFHLAGQILFRRRRLTTWRILEGEAPEPVSPR
ncbi:MAG: hypothetical protein RL885_13305 [Planctomycetota bacterium]